MLDLIDAQGSSMAMTHSTVEHGAGFGPAALAQFRDAIVAAGLTPPDVIEADGKLRRFSSNGKLKDDAGWYVLHAGVVPAGAIGDHRTGVHQNWRADIGRTLTPAEEAAYRARIEAMRLVREREEARRRAGAAKKAAALWAAAKPANADHPYLLRKKVQPVGNLLELDASTAASILGYMPRSSGEALSGRILVAPVYIDGTLSTCELIDDDGRKSAIYGGAKSGGYWAAQSLPDDRAGLVLFIGEGVATTLTVLEASGHASIAALSAGNLLAVAKAMRKRYPAALLVLVADLVKATGEPDHHAVQAAQAVGGLLLVPTFGDDRASSETDINDMAARLGLDEVRRIIEATINPSQPAQEAPQGVSAAHCLVSLPEAAAAAGAASSDDSGSLRPRFEVSASGVSYIGVKHDSKAEADIELPPVRLCDRLDIIGRGEDDSGRGYRILRWNSRGSGTERVTAFPLAMIGEREGWAMLKERGLAIATSRAALEKLSEYLQTEGSDELYFVTECGGWTHGAYILPSGEVLGTPSAPLFYRGDTSGAGAYTTKGTLEEWRNTVARLAHGNTRPMLSLAVAFAAPLLHLVDLESGGFHLYGPSGAGKTTSAKIGASVWGSPREQVLNWDATALALANAASARNDGLMLLDEMGQGNPEAVSMAAYRLFNGTGKMQGAKDGGNREQARWRVMVLSTGEIDLAAFMSGGGKRTRAGQEVRLASLPADVGKGLGAFDQLNGFANSGQLAEAMEAAALQTHGTVGRAFVERIAVQRTEITSRLRSAIKKIHAGLPEGASGQVRRVAARFAVAAEALEIATDEGMTGWDQGAGLAAVMACFASWLSRYGTGNREDEQIIEQAEAWFGAHAFSRFIDCLNASQSNVHNCAGYRKKDSAGVPFWLVFPGTFTDEIAAGFDKIAAGDVLEKAGILQKGNDGKATSKHRTPDQPEPHRFYKFVNTERKDKSE
jgi:putative DNA primase/helicase